MSDIEIYHQQCYRPVRTCILRGEKLNMFTVIDTIRISREMIEKYGEHFAVPKKEGLLVVLDPDQIRGPISKPDKVRLSKPDGATFTLSVDEVQISGGVVALFFSSIDQAEVPRGSVIDLLP
jgi:hypothetical protein